MSYYNELDFENNTKVDFNDQYKYEKEYQEYRSLKCKESNKNFSCHYNEFQNKIKDYQDSINDNSRIQNAPQIARSRLCAIVYHITSKIETL